MIQLVLIVIIYEINHIHRAENQMDRIYYNGNCLGLCQFYMALGLCNLETTFPPAVSVHSAWATRECLLKVPIQQEVQQVGDLATGILYNSSYLE